MTGGIPVGYQDLVEVWFVVGQAPEMVCLDKQMSRHSAPDDTKKVMVTRCREVPRNPGEVGTGDCGLAAHSGGDRGNPRCRIS